MIAGPVLYSNHTQSGTVKSGPGILYAVTLTAGSDAATLIVYDNTSATGTIILKLAAAAANTSATLAIPNGVSFGAGCHFALTGTAPSASGFYA